MSMYHCDIKKEIVDGKTQWRIYVKEVKNKRSVQVFTSYESALTTAFNLGSRLVTEEVLDNVAQH